jgi:hypothetical protein
LLEDQYRNIHSGENLKSQKVIKMVKLRRIRWAGHVRRLGKIRNAYRVFQTSKGRYHSEDLSVDMRIVLQEAPGK